MPRGDGTGPNGQGPQSGWGTGPCARNNQGNQQGGRGGGRGGRGLGGRGGGGGRCRGGMGAGFGRNPMPAPPKETPSDES
ncbi:DUF5320 domain-containing protein [Desulfoluna butyratoxydans]|uniref:DUF5320 domain-containing protein n=1 Tax=Desulfoluna butyratoxydans TaxID=231438 RepID=UPI0015D207D1